MAVLVDSGHPFQGADVEGVLRDAVAGVLALELTMGLSNTTSLALVSTPPYWVILASSAFNRCFIVARSCGSQMLRTLKGETSMPRWRNSLATRAWPQAGCSTAMATTAASISESAFSGYWSGCDGRAMIRRKLQPAAFRLPLGHLQPFPTPHPLYSLAVHRPARVPQQRRDPTIAVSPIPLRQFDDISRLSGLILHPRGTFRCVERCCPSIAQALRSKIAILRTTCSTQTHGAELTIFPTRLRSG
jgi:hypothetical protein